MTIRIITGLLLACVLSPAHAAPGCASPDEARRVRELYAQAPQPPTFMAADKLKLSEAVVASALPATMAVGVPGSEFAAVWTSLGTWDKATTLIRQGGHIFEVVTRVPAGKPSERPGSKFFNLVPGTGLNGHLRPDLISAIYALRLDGPEGPIRGLVFLDPEGASVFGVFTGEGPDQPAALTAQFDATWALLKTLPRACG